MINITEVVNLAIRSLWRNKTRSALTMLGIIIGVSAVILLVSIGQGLQKYITGQFESLGTNLIIVVPGKVGVGEGAGFSQGPPNFAGSKLTLEQTESISALGGAVESAAASIELPSSVSYGSNSKYTTVAGVSSGYGKIRNLTASEGRLLTPVDINLSRNVVVLGKGISDDLFGLSDPLGKDVNIGTSKYQVIGILSDIGGGASIGFDINNFVAIPITSSQKTFGNNNVQAITVKATSKDLIPQAILEVKNYLSKQLKEDDFSVVDQSSLVSTINQILGVLTLALGGIAAISLVVGGVGIMNIMLVSVTERTREIGLRKAVGAKPNDIRNQFLVEAVVLSVSGGIVGILIGSLGSLALKSFIATSVSFWSVLLAFGVSAGVGIIFGVTPALRASKLNPIDALRYE